MTNHTGTSCPAIPLCKNTAPGAQAEAGSTALTKLAAAAAVAVAAEGSGCNCRGRRRTSPARRAES